MGQEIGWSQQAKLLEQINKSIKRLTQVVSATPFTTSTTTTAP